MCHSAGNRGLLIIYKTPLIISFKFIEDGGRGGSDVRPPETRIGRNWDRFSLRGSRKNNPVDRADALTPAL